MQTEQLLCWSGMTDTKHTTTSDLNEEECMSKLSTHYVYKKSILQGKTEKM